MALATQEVIRRERVHERTDTGRNPRQTEFPQHQMRGEGNGRECEDEEQVDGGARPSGDAGEHAEEQHVQVVGALRQVGKILPKRPAEIRVVQIAAVLTETSGQHQVEVGIASPCPRFAPRRPPQPQVDCNHRDGCHCNNGRLAEHGSPTQRRADRLHRVMVTDLVRGPERRQTGFRPIAITDKPKGRSTFFSNARSARAT